jgi:hypothetical protein
VKRDGSLFPVSGVTGPAVSSGSSAAIGDLSPGHETESAFARAGGVQPRAIISLRVASMPSCEMSHGLRDADLFRYGEKQKGTRQKNIASGRKLSN